MSSAAPPSPTLSHRQIGVGAALIMTALVFGLFAEYQAFGFNNPRRWVPDYLVGVGFILSGGYVLRKNLGTSLLLIGAGMAWWLGTVLSAATYLHRGFLIHALVTYPGWRARSWLGAATIAIAYPVMLLPQSGTDWGTAVMGVGLVVAAAVRWWQSVGRTRRYRMTALLAAIGVFLGTAVAAMARMIVDSLEVVEPLLWLYESSLVIVATLLGLGLRPSKAAVIADVVVEMDRSTSGTLRDTLARLLGDPSLQVGFSDADGRFRDTQGILIDLPDNDASRLTTFVDRGEHARAVIIHDSSVPEGGALLDAVASVTRLSAVNSALIGETEALLGELVASRRRLLVAEDDERRRLEARLHEGAEQHLNRIGELLSSIDSRPSANDAVSHHIGRAVDQLRLARQELNETARGLHPRELQAGLESALVALCSRAPLPVGVTVTGRPVVGDAAVAVFYVCAEALSNVVKHAHAERATIQVDSQNGVVVVTVADDGIGGASMARGSGLVGLSDRVASVGGTLRVESPVGIGTRLTAEIPLGGEPSGRPVVSPPLRPHRS